MPIAAPVAGGFLTVYVGWEINLHIIGTIGLLVTLGLWVLAGRDWRTGAQCPSNKWYDRRLPRTVEVATFLRMLLLGLVLRRPVCYSNQSLFRPNRVYGRKLRDVRTALCRRHGRELSGVLAVRAIGRKYGRTRLIIIGSVICLISGIAALGVVLLMEFPPRYCLAVTGVHGWVRSLIHGRHSGGHVSPADGRAGIVAYRLGAIWRGAAASMVMGLAADGTDLPLSAGLAVCGLLSLFAIILVLTDRKK